MLQDNIKIVPTEAEAVLNWLRTGSNGSVSIVEL
jgi:hypothetical protein